MKTCIDEVLGGVSTKENGEDAKEVLKEKCFGLSKPKIRFLGK